MIIFEWAKTIFHWVAGIIGVLFGLYLAALFVACVPSIVVSGSDSYSRIKRALLRVLCIFFVLGIATLIVWVGPLAPKKDLLVVTKELPRLDGGEGTSPAYCIYYVWDGEQEEHPWWVVFQRPREDDISEWAIVETADIDNVRDSNDVIEAFCLADRFDSSWFKKGMHRVQRTRLGKLRGIVGTDENFEKEKKAIEHVVILIDKNNQELQTNEESEDSTPLYNHELEEKLRREPQRR